MIRRRYGACFRSNYIRQSCGCYDCVQPCREDALVVWPLVWSVLWSDLWAKLFNCEHCSSLVFGMEFLPSAYVSFDSFDFCFYNSARTWERRPRHALFALLLVLCRDNLVRAESIYKISPIVIFDTWRHWIQLVDGCSTFHFPCVFYVSVFITYLLCIASVSVFP